MTATNHAITGALIVAVVPHAYVGVPLALLSHVALDVIPHFGAPSLALKKFLPILLGDAFLASLILVAIPLLRPVDPAWIMVGAVAGMSPDLLSIPYFIDSIKGKAHQFGLVQRFLSRIQWSETVKGLWVEAGWFMVMGTLLLKVLAK